MLNNEQIKLVQTAVRAAGIRPALSRSKAGPTQNDRYHLLLRQYKQPNGSAVTSCTQLNNSQLEDLLAICESQGWRMPGKPENFYRLKVAAGSYFASFAMQSAIKHLAADLGWNEWQLGGLLERMTSGKVCAPEHLTPREAYKIIEGLKAMFNREKGTSFKNLNEIKTAIKDGPPHDSCAEAACGINTGGIPVPRGPSGVTDGANQIA